MAFKNKVVVITGASQGFGKALAKALKQENAQVVISSHDNETLEATAKELLVDYFLADVTSFDNIKKLALPMGFMWLLEAKIICRLCRRLQYRQNFWMKDWIFSFQN